MMKWFNIAAILVCIGITGLNQYVTHCNANVWLAGDQYNQRIKESNDMIFRIEVAYAEAFRRCDVALSLADSERIRAEKLQYERDAAVDANRKMRMYIVQLHRKCEDSGIDLQEFQKSCR